MVSTGVDYQSGPPVTEGLAAITAVSLNNDSEKWVSLLATSYRGENAGTGRLSNFFKTLLAMQT